MTLGGAGDAAGGPYPPYGVFASPPELSLAVGTDGGRRRRGRAGSVARGGIGGGSAKDAPGAEDDSQSAMGGHLDGVLVGGGEDDDEDGNPRKRKKRIYRHTPHQIQELEAFFKENDHPKPQQRAELSKHLGLVLQESCIDKSGAMVVYAPVDFAVMQFVMGGGDSTNVALLPSGFAILPEGSCTGGVGHKTSGSLLTVAFQILVNSQPTAKLTVESVDTMNNLISYTIEKIKAALHCE